jgi:hypothetical protein
VGRGGDAPRYERYRPETILLYQLVERHCPAFLAALAERGRHLPGYMQEEFAAYLKCGRLEYGFLRVHCTHAAGKCAAASATLCENPGQEKLNMIVSVIIRLASR